MTYPNAIVISAALIAIAIAFSARQPAQSAMDSRQYVAAGATDLTVWVLDTTTGQIRWCQTGACRVGKLE